MDTTCASQIMCNMEVYIDNMVIKNTEEYGNCEDFNGILSLIK